MLERDLYVTAGVDVPIIPAEVDADAGVAGLDFKATVNPGPKFEGCTPQEKDQITTALGSTIEYLDNSVSYLETFPAPAASLRYKEWFGTFFVPISMFIFTNEIDTQANMIAAD